MTEQAINESVLRCVEALLMAADGPLSIDRIVGLLAESGAPDRKAVRVALDALTAESEGRAAALVEVAGGWRYQVRSDYAGLIGKLWEEKPPRLTRALLETLALIVYRQPISRGEIEQVRGVAVSSNIVKTLLEREWVRIVGYREVPGRPALFGTTRQFLDDFNLKSLEQLPTLPELKDLDQLDEAMARLRADSGEGAEPRPEATAEDDLGNADAPGDAPVEADEPPSDSLH